MQVCVADLPSASLCCRFAKCQFVLQTCQVPVYVADLPSASLCCRLAKCQFVVNAREDDDHPVVDLRIEFLGEEGCGDVLTIYDGKQNE